MKHQVSNGHYLKYPLYPKLDNAAEEYRSTYIISKCPEELYQMHICTHIAVYVWLFIYKAMPAA